MSHSNRSGRLAYIRGLFRVPDIRFGAPLDYGAVLGIILLLNFLVVCVLIKNFSASWDELLINEYSQRISQVYQNLAFNEPYQSLIVFHDLHFYGPAYWTLVNVAAGPIVSIFPALDRFDVFHLMNFATFLAGVWCLFCLLRRFVTPQASFVATLLYLTQPLLWGHGVINPKDTPFATLFLGTILLGLRMLEKQAAAQVENPPCWKIWGKKRKSWTGILLVVVLVMFLDLVFSHFISRPLLSELVSHAYSSKPGDFLHSILQMAASNWAATPPAAYIAKSLRFVNFIEFTLVLIVAFLAAGIWFARTNARYRAVVLAGIIAGLATSTRVLGPAAMGLVALYAVLKVGRKSFPMLVAYLAVAVIVAYASWPYLWSAPFNHFLDSWRLMANFPWRGVVRFEGLDLKSTGLPWYYLPKLMAIQLTLPALGLAVVGLGISIPKIVRKLPNWEWRLMSGLWFLVPLAWVIVTHPALYDNFRQFLFIIPPLFFFAAITLEVVFQKVTSVLLKVVACAFILLPGVVAGFWLHPYQYVYYNALVGWTAQVDRSYEGDYWLTSFCEAARYLNEAAPEGTRIVFTEGPGITIFSRCRDKNFVYVLEDNDATASYSVLSSRYDADLTDYPRMGVVKVIGRGKTVFSVVKEKTLPPGESDATSR